MARIIAFFVMIILILIVPVTVSELIVRALDNYSVSSLRLVKKIAPDANLYSDEFSRQYLEELTFNNDVDIQWYDDNPKISLTPVTSDLSAIHKYKSFSEISENDVYKVWNANFIEDVLCRDSYFDNFPGFIFLYDEKSGSKHPRYRFLPNVVTPIGLKTNSMGWRSPEISRVKAEDIFRVAFLGASTTVNSHQYPFSYPELVLHWLNLWAQEAGSSVKFEVINLGREGISSPDIAAAFIDEAIPYSPDFAVYYEGSNQFSLSAFADVAHIKSKSGTVHEQISVLKKYSAIFNRITTLVARFSDGQAEPLKPEYIFSWPEDVDESFPDLSNENLPSNLSTILNDLRKIKESADRAGTHMVLSSFIWLANESLILDPVKHQTIYRYLNDGMYPYKYKDIGRVSDFQNTVFKKFASEENISFIDLESIYPKDPNLFKDAIHNTYGGVKLRAWVVFQQILPLIKQQLVNKDTSHLAQTGNSIFKGVDFYTANFNCQSVTPLSSLSLELSDIELNNDLAKVSVDTSTIIETAPIANNYAAELKVPQELFPKKGEYRITINAKVSGEDAALGVLSGDKSKFLSYKFIEASENQKDYSILFETDGSSALYLMFISGPKDYGSTVILDSVSLERLSSIHNLKRTGNGISVD